MKRYSLWVKSLCFFLAVVTLLCVAVSALGILFAESRCMYTHDDYTEWLYAQYHDAAQMIADQVMLDYGGELSDCPQWVLEQTGHLNAIIYMQNWFELSAEEWCYSIQQNGKVLRSTRKTSIEENSLHFLFEQDLQYPMTGMSNDTEYFWNSDTEGPVPVHYVSKSGYQVDVWINRNHTSDYDGGLSPNTLKWIFDARYPMVVIAAASLLIFVVAFIILMALAGKNPKTGEANPRALNRLPLDLYLAAAVGITVLGCWMAIELLDMLFGKYSYNVLMVVLLCGCGLIVATTDVGFFAALAAQFKVTGGFWWRHTLCAKVLKLVWKALTWLWRGIKRAGRFVGRAIDRFFRMIPVIWEWLLIGFVLALGLFITILLCVEEGEMFILLMFWWCCVGVIIIGYGGWCYGTIRKGIRRMKEGSLEEKIDTRYMYGSFKVIAEDLNTLADVVAIAAEKQLKSERMKTELITNVSHDIKTPLTSVINYVDLLQQPHTEEEGAQYLEVLSRQSLRLKKLVEDLMDMSKASSGNMSVHITHLDAVEAVNQALGEFSDKLAAADLTPVFRCTDSQLIMKADGRLTWRVLSNLLGNVVKYALPGTRVYLDLQRQNKTVLLSLKNISREELNISAEELTERFVRGDASRNTEGSGLGLNIAQSLMHLQQGSMGLTVDGDLFKVTLIFPGE